MLKLLLSLLLSFNFCHPRLRTAEYLGKPGYALPSSFVSDQLYLSSPLNCIFRCLNNPKCLSATTSHKVFCILYFQDYRNLQDIDIQTLQKSNLFSVIMLDCFVTNVGSIVEGSDDFVNDVCNLEIKIDQPKWIESSEWTYVIEKTCIGNDVLFVIR